MTERDQLCDSIAATIKEYEGGIDATRQHVDQWASQFTEERQLAFLREFAHVINKSFITRENVLKFIKGLVLNEKLTGGDPKSYWAKANFLKIQQHGQSQKEMLALFDASLQEILGLKLADCGKPDGDFIYLDDILFTGNRVASDLQQWIANAAPQKAHVNVIVIAYYSGGQYYISKKRLPTAAIQAKKNITFTWWRIAAIENQPNRKDASGVLWPAVIPDVPDVKEYLASEKKFPLSLRIPGGPLGVFSSEDGRQLLESEFLIAGVKIRSGINNPKPILRPLGFGQFGAGFGSTLVTYRNCPNNCPLALWWGDPKATSGPLKWYPLLPRKTYADVDFDDFDF